MLAFADRWTWDFWLADDGERHHVFYLQAPKSLGDPARRHDHATVGHAVSDDLVAWTPVVDALSPGPPGAWDEIATWTGSIVAHDGGWTTFYTGRSTRDQGRIQRIGRASSADLGAWPKDPANPILEVGPPYERFRGSGWHEEAWRDPWVFPDSAGGGFHALITARLGSGDERGRGVVAHATSADLASWTLRDPITRGEDFGHLEVPQVELVGDRWVLVFSCAIREIAPAGRERRPHEAGGSFWVVGPSPLGPFDVRDAVQFVQTELYSMRLVRCRDGSWVALGFIDHVDGRFVGALSDPVPVPFA